LTFAFLKKDFKTKLMKIKQYGYGFFCGGDPRDFYPDTESCSDNELLNHNRACALWNEAEARGETPTPEKCPSGFIFGEDGKCLGHVLRAPYGIGGYSYWEETNQ